MLRACLVSLAVLLVVALSAASPVSAAASSEVKYFVLIDAGSTGSRAHVHTYTTSEASPLPAVEESINKKIQPGLSSYAKDPPAASVSIKDLLAFIRATVPEAQWKNTPIHLHATAGLRSVTPAEAHAVLEVVRDDLSQSGFLFERSWAKIISGEQEGINGWMAVNYLLGVFDEPIAAGAPAPISTGVVEMGGSSMQITFAPSAPSADDRKQLTEVVIAGRSYWLYTHSFLQYGLQAAAQLYQKLAINDIEEHGNPCYPRSYRHSSVGDFDRCTSLLSSVVDKSVKCATSSCSFNGVYQPQIKSEQFLAIENFYYTAKFFGNADQQDQTTPGEKNAVQAAPTGNQVTSGLRAKGKEFCNKDWPSLLSEHNEKATPKELSQYCFSAAYQSVVLESGLGFHSGANLRVAKTIKGKGIDWEMGATIFEIIKPAASTTTTDTEIDPTMLPTSNGDPGLPMVVRPTSRVGGGVVARPHSGFCASCAGYTLLFGLTLVLGYVGYARYSSKRAAGSMTSYTNSAFNRV